MWNPIQYTFNNVIQPKQKTGRKLKVLFINTYHDYITAYASAFSDQLIKVISDNKLIQVFHLKGVFATYPLAISKILKHKFDLVVYMGHGVDDAWWDGFMGYLWKNEWVKLFKDSIIYTVSCKTATTYGQMFINNGTKAYIGNTEVVYGGMKLKEHNFGKDFARIFQAELINLLMGEKVSSVVEFAKNEWNSLSLKYKMENSKLFNQQADRAKYNGEFHTFVGDPNSCLPQVINDTNDMDLTIFKQKNNLFL